jgi:hypothetical protein
MTIARFLILAAMLGACTAEVPVDREPDLDDDSDLQAMLADPMPETAAVDVDTAEMPAASEAARTSCTKHRFLHVANYSYVAKISECVNGACPNGCWGVQERTGGFSCDYDASAADFIKTRDGGGPFASYNEIKPLNAHDAAAVASCRAQSGLPVRTYSAWNGTGWSSEGIAAQVHYAELYGPQKEMAPEFWTWHDGWRASFAPMANFSPETAIDAAGVKAWTARLCSSTRDGWLGIYFYDATNSNGVGMAPWKREMIIRGMNYCTTH